MLRSVLGLRLALALAPIVAGGCGESRANGDADSGGSAGVDGGAGGAGGAVALACAAACRESDCCIAHDELSCSNWATENVAVELLSETPELPEGMLATSDPVRVTHCENDSAYPVVLRFTVDDPQANAAFVLHFDERGDPTPFPFTVEVDTVIVEANANGTYLVGAFELPDGCESETFAGSVEAATDKELHPLEGITQLRGNLSLTGGVSSVDALRCLTWIRGNLVVRDADLHELDLAALTMVDGLIWVTRDGNLEEIGLGKVRFVGRSTFDDLPELVRLDIGNVVTTGELRLIEIGTATEESLELDLGSLKTVEGLSIQATNLKTLDGPRSLEHVGGPLLIMGNNRLETIDNLSSLRTTASVWLKDNPLLSRADLGALDSITDTVVGSLVVDNLPELVQLDLGSLAEAGALELTNIGADTPDALQLDLGSLNRVREDMNLTNLANLVDVGAFVALQAITASLTVSENPRLANLDGFAALASVGADLAITSNSALPTCEASELRTQLEDAGFDGTATISDNLPGDCD